MKFNFIIAAFLIIIIGWISLFQINGKIEKSNFLKSHICQEQLRLVSSFRDYSESNKVSQNESFLNSYNSLVKNNDLLLSGGEYSYSGLDISLSPERTELVVAKLSDFNLMLEKLGQTISQSSNKVLESNVPASPVSGLDQELIEKLVNKIDEINSHFEFDSENYSAGKFMYILLLAFITIVASLISIALFKKEYRSPIAKLNAFSDELTSGTYNPDHHSVPNKQFNTLHFNLNKIGNRLQDAISFVDHIGKGNMDVEFQTEGSADQLGTSLLHLKDELRKANLKEQARRWANEGLTEFNKIIQENNEDIKVLAQKLISETVKYVSANQGAIFQIINEEDEQNLELISAYAWDREKFVDKKLDLKSNLIGQTILEREYMLIKEIPDEFVSITSGLGEATPQSLIIIPLIFNDVCCGAIELASFTEFDKKTISFLNQLSENIASAILNITGNVETNKLLKESQTLTEQLRIQEEELKQNEEELEASQDNLSRKLEEAIGEMEVHLKKIDSERAKNLAILEGCEDGVVMFNNKGVVEFTNSALEEILGQKKRHLVKNNISEILPVLMQKDDEDVFNMYYNTEGQNKLIGTRTEINMLDGNENELSLLVTFSKGKVGKDVTFAFFIQKISVELF